MTALNLLKGYFMPLCKFCGVFKQPPTHFITTSMIKRIPNSTWQPKLVGLEPKHGVEHRSRSRIWHGHNRNLHTSCEPLRHEGKEWEEPKCPDEIVTITYVLKDGRKMSVDGKCGDNVMYMAHRHDIGIEGACEASLACCTCHVYVNDEYFDKLTDAEEKEEDMLDMAPFLKVNSRLSCQIILSKELDGMEVTLPQATRNFYVDGHVPQPH